MPFKGNFKSQVFLMNPRLSKMYYIYISHPCGDRNEVYKQSSQCTKIEKSKDQVKPVYNTA